jgi:imidazoleglycerol phosphate dehydratase HisB
VKGAVTMRQATITRNTNETKITVALTLEGKGTADIQTGCGDDSIFQSLRKIFFYNDWSAAKVQKNGRWLHLAKRFCVHEVFCIFIQWCMH